MTPIPELVTWTTVLSERLDHLREVLCSSRDSHNLLQMTSTSKSTAEELKATGSKQLGVTLRTKLYKLALPALLSVAWLEFLSVWWTTWLIAQRTLRWSKQLHRNWLPLKWQLASWIPDIWPGDRWLCRWSTLVLLSGTELIPCGRDPALSHQVLGALVLQTVHTRPPRSTTQTLPLLIMENPMSLHLLTARVFNSPILQEEPRR